MNITSFFYKIKRYGPMGISYVLGLEKVSSPMHIHLEITNICNFRCIYCPQSKPDEHFQLIGKGKMTFETYKAIVDKLIAAYKIERFILTRDGEPLAHPQLVDFIIYARERGMKPSIGSNGSLITPEKAKQLIAGGLYSLKGDFCADKNYFEKIRAGGKFEDALQGYLNLLRAAKEADADFRMALVDLYSYKLNDPAEINESLTRLKALFNGYESWLSVGPAKMHNALGEAQQTFSISRRRPGRRYNRCHHPWLEMVIDYRGNVVGCCRDLRSEYQVGNILEAEDINRDLWNGDKMRYLRNNLRKKRPDKINICSKCDLPYGESYAGKSISDKIKRFLFQY
ncbi:MAG TPA: radical SAM/SPASM domain-containing protein [Calditrichaeota bacterium]|nr:radical SAM/SPASM domain-containing protein [Calditrichota bacterium]